jgi:serine/threonine protein kinase
MSAESRRVTKTEVWVGWENQVVNGVYPLRRFLGGSNHSAVFLTEYRAEGVPNAAIKLMPADALETEAQLVQWGTAATLSHPSLIRLFDVGRCHLGGRAFLFVVMEYADQTLAQILPRRALSPDEVREMLLPTLSALAFLHRNNLVQGQLKPTNLLVVNDQLKLASDTIRSTGYLTGGILRASLYDPPELKDGEISTAGDVWGLGITLVEALTQHPPAWPDQKSETVSLAASIPEPFADTVRRCLNQTPANRPTARELEAQYNPALHAHPITVVAEEPVYEAPSEPEPPPPATSSRGVLVPALLAVLVISLAVWVGRTIFHTGPSSQRSASQQAAARISRAQSGAGAAAIIARADESAGDTSSGEASTGGATARHTPPMDVSAEDRSPGSRSAANVADGPAVGTPVAASSPDAYRGGGSTHDSPDTYRSGGSTAGGADAYGSGRSAASAPGAYVSGRSAAGATGKFAAETSAGGASAATTVAAVASVPITAAPTARVPVASTDAGAENAATTASPSDQSSPPAPELLGSVLHEKLPDVTRVIRDKIRGHVTVTVRVLVDPSGNVVGEFFESVGPSRYFARLAGDAAGEWKFVPTDQRGPRVWMLRFEFTRAGVTVNTVGTQ